MLLSCTVATSQVVVHPQLNNRSDYFDPHHGIRSKILILEYEEAQARLSHDTIRLILLWERDFFAQRRANKVVSAKSTLPRFLILRRLVENVIASDTIAYTMGEEHVLTSDDPIKDGAPIKRSFRHVWRNHDGVWRLSRVE
jgi:hypothetical protein